MAKTVEFNIKVTMNERWVNDFCSMLHWMESCGKLGHSSVVAFYSDGLDQLLILIENIRKLKDIGKN